MIKNIRKMKKSLFLISFALIFLISFISADIEGYNCIDNGISLTIKYQPTIKQGEDYFFSTHIYNSTGGQPLNNDSAYCALHVYNPKGQHIITDNDIDFGINTYDFYLNIDANNFSEPNNYPFVHACFFNDGVGSGHCEGSLKVNPTGSILEDYQMNLFIIIFVMLFVMLLLSIYGINKAVKGEWQIFYICLAYILLFSMFFLLWLVSKNYLYEINLLESIFWIIWIILGILFFPFLIFVSSYLLKKQAEKMLEEEYVGQGYTKEEALEMSKKRR
jgi:hypothetical protein